MKRFLILLPLLTIKTYGNPTSGWNEDFVWNGDGIWPYLLGAALFFVFGVIITDWYENYKEQRKEQKEIEKNKSKYRDRYWDGGWKFKSKEFESDNNIKK